MKKKIFLSKNGRLYFFEGARGSAVSYQYTDYQIIKKTPTYRKIKATSYYWETEEYKETKVDIYKQRKINGRWVFTSITLPY